MLEPHAALEDLRARLAAAGFDEAAPDLPTLWTGYRTWAAQPVRGMDPGNDTDMLLFDGSLDLAPAGAYRSGPRFELALVRQFYFLDEAGEYDHIEQLGARLRYAPTDAFRRITTFAAGRGATFGSTATFWGGGGPEHGPVWCALVEATVTWRVALAHEPIAVELF